MGGERGLRAGLGLDRGADDVVDRAGRGQEGLAGDLRLDGRAGRRLLGGAADQLDEVGAALEVVEADVELGAWPQPGMTLVALLDVATAVISRLEGWNDSLPSSRWSASSAAIILASFGTGLSARCG